MVRLKLVSILLLAVASVASAKVIVREHGSDSAPGSNSEASDSYDDDSTSDSWESAESSSSDESINTSTMAENLATAVTATSTVTSTYPNWVGTWSLPMDNKACYREAHIMDTCPTNYDRNELTNTCWTECPLEFPVECGMECIRQNDDCALEITSKVSAVALAIVSVATAGIFAEFEKMGRKLTRAAACARTVLTVSRGILRYVRNVKSEDPQTTRDKLLLMLYQTNHVVTDIPIAIYTCMGKPVPSPLRMSQIVMATSQWMLLQILANEDDIISSVDKFKAFLKGANFTEAAEEITEGEISNLKTAMQSNSSCGDDMKSLTDRTWQMVNEYRAENPAITDDELRLKISESDFMLYDIATVTNNCMDQLIKESNVETAYKTREVLRKTFGVIINDLIKSGSSNNGTSIAAKEKALKWIDTGLTTLSVSMLDVTNLSTLLAEYLQRICGATQFMGEIDDGTEPATLGLNMIKKAFTGSSISWKKKGDGKVLINFSSTDTKDVTVNIMSGGDKVAEVDVPAGGKATWKSTVKALGGKTLYLDRWRPGVMGLPGTGGGSLVLWVPIARNGGRLELEAKLNVS